MSEQLAFTIKQWCDLRGISLGTYYNLGKRDEQRRRELGRALTDEERMLPEMYYVGVRGYISVAADQRWEAASIARSASKPRDPKLSEIRRAAGALGNQSRIERATRPHRAARE